MFATSRRYVAAAGLDEPLICYQGAVVADPVSGAFMRHEPVRVDVAREAIAEVDAAGFPVEAFVDDRLYVARSTPETLKYVDTRNVEENVVGDLVAWLERPPTKLVALGEARALDGLAASLKPRFDGRLTIAKSLPWLLEFSSPTATKGQALEFVADRLGFALAQTVAFGDGENDLGLFAPARYGVAVANADKRLLARADLICPPADEEGVAAVIEAYLDSNA
jgi:hydroxymethylpyrimidine pyrophosphatase-like HAD family hydrolase